MLLAVLVAYVESSQPHRGATEIDGADAPDQPRQPERYVFWPFAFEEHQRDECRRRAKADDIRKTVQLPAEVCCVPGESCQTSVQRIENHRRENEIRRGEKFVREEPLRPRIAADVC